MASESSRVPLRDASTVETETEQQPPEPRNRKSVYHGLNHAEHASRYGRLPRSASSSSWRNRCEKLVSARLLPKSWARSMLGKVPVVDVFRTYRFRRYIVGDILAGLSVGLVAVPQGLGYARLAGVPAVLGLYTSVFPVFVYFVFGTSRHLSMGAAALCCLAVAEAVRKYGIDGRRAFSFNGTRSEFNETSSDVAKEAASGFTVEETRAVAVAASVSFLAGVFLVSMSIVRLGFVASFMSEPFVSGCLGANGLRILTYQFGDMLGAANPVGGHYTGPGDYFYGLFATLIYSIPGANWLSVVVSALSVVTLVVVKRCINERLASRIKVPIPIDFIVVIIFTTASHFGQFEKFGVKILKTVPKGIPEVTVPSIGIMTSCVFDAFMLAIVAYMTLGMMAKLLSQRHHNYPVDNDQELLANGLSALGGALFCSIAPSASPPRTLLMESSGGQTQVAYVVGGLLSLLSVLVVAPMFRSLPVCVLSSVVFVDSMTLLSNMAACVGYWRTNKYDFAVFAFTAAVSLVLPVALAVAIGVAFSLVLVHFRMRRSEAFELSINEEDLILLNRKDYSRWNPNDKMVIFRFESPLYFATLDVFTERLFKSTISLSKLSYLRTKSGRFGDRAAHLPKIIITAASLQSVDDEISPSQPQVNPGEANHSQQNSFNVGPGCDSGASVDDTKQNDDQLGDYEDPDSNYGDETELQLPRNIVVDCSAISFLDTSGAKTLARLHGEYSQFNIRFLLANCCSGFIDQLKRVDQCRNLIAESVYPSIQDIIVSIDC